MEIEAKYSKLKDIDILKDVIEPINNKTLTTEAIANKYDVSVKRLKEYIKFNGYIWRGVRYISKDNIKKCETKKNAKKKDTTEKIKVTYNIDKELQKLVKLQSIIEDTDNSTIIEKAINSYVSEKTKETLKNL